MNSKLVWLVAGCVGAYASSAQEVGTHLPNGVTLLGADSTSCDGALVIQSGLEDARDDVARVREGQFVVLEVDNPNVGMGLSRRLVPLRYDGMPGRDDPRAHPAQRG